MKQFLKSWKFWSLLALVAVIAAGSVVYRLKLIDLSGVPAQAGSADTAAEPSGGTSAVASPAASAAVQAGAGQSVVSIVRSSQAKVDDIQYDEIKRMVTQAVDLAGGFEGLIKDGQTVVLKPNLVTINDYTLPGWTGKPCAPQASGNATDWRITKAVVELVRQYNPSGNVYVMEGSAVDTEQAFRHYLYTPEDIPGVTAFLPIEKDSGAWRDYNSDGVVKVTPKGAMLHDSYYLNKKYATCDVLISLPCMKTHWNALVSGAVKNVAIGSSPANIYGVDKANNGRNNMVNHDTDDFNKWMHDWILCRPVDFAIMDGLQGIQNGPTPCYEVSGTTDIAQDQMNERIILASCDAIALDAVEAQVMNWDPYSVTYLKYLEQSGAGNVNTANIRVAGNTVSDVRQDFALVRPKAETPQKIGDFTAPVLEVKEAVIADGKLTITAASSSADAGRAAAPVTGGFDTFQPSDKDACKAELLVDGKYVSTTVPADYSNFTVTVPVSELGAGDCTAELAVYDRFFNRAACAITIKGGKVASIGASK